MFHNIWIVSLNTSVARTIVLVWMGPQTTLCYFVHLYFLKYLQIEFIWYFRSCSAVNVLDCELVKNPFFLLDRHCQLEIWSWLTGGTTIIFTMAHGDQALLTSKGMVAGQGQSMAPLLEPSNRWNPTNGWQRSIIWGLISSVELPFESKMKSYVILLFFLGWNKFAHAVLWVSIFSL